MAAVEVRYYLKLIIKLILDLQYFAEAICCNCYPDFGKNTGSEVLELLRHFVFSHLHQCNIFTEADFVKRNHHIIFGDQ